MAELADAPGSGPGERKLVRVRIPPSALTPSRCGLSIISLYFILEFDIFFL